MFTMNTGAGSALVAKLGALAGGSGGALTDADRPLIAALTAAIQKTFKAVP